jgi:predicted outer membrane repeat protein
MTNSTIDGNRAGDKSGGIVADTSTVLNSTISDNFAGTHGGGLSAFDTKITNSTFSNNSAGTDGGAIDAYLVQIANSTISGNTADSEGGGVHANTGAIVNTTITDNTAHVGGGVFHYSSIASLSLKNCIIAQNSDFTGSAPDVFGTFTNHGHNLIGIIDGSDGLTSFGNTNIYGSFFNPLDARLGVLKFNGGPTQTHALLAGSPAINAGDSSVLSDPEPLTKDQRGVARKRGAAVDIGAFERW